MKLPNSILAKYVARFDSLIAEGRSILDSAKEVPASRSQSWTGESFEVGLAYKQLDSDRFVEWRTKAATLLANIVPKSHVHRDAVEKLPTLEPSDDSLQTAVSLLKEIKDDLEKGFLDDLSSAIEAEIAADYMGQAEGLLAEGQSGRYDHVPAAVLAGAVLEATLRALCDEQQPPVALTNAQGEKKTLNPLIDDLKKAGVFNELKAKQLRSWTDIRNKAAHGEFDQFKKTDVEQMIHGIKNFLADYR